METYTIYSKWLAYELRKAGFEILKTGINPNHPQYETWDFEDTEALHKEMLKLTKQY